MKIKNIHLLMKFTVNRLELAALVPGLESEINGIRKLTSASVICLGCRPNKPHPAFPNSATEHTTLLNTLYYAPDTCQDPPSHQPQPCAGVTHRMFLL
jgi:hypothetical protein